MEYYVATIHKDEGTHYGVSFHDFPGCTSAGATLNDAIQNANEALSLHIDGMLEDKDQISEPSALEVVRDADGSAEAYVLVPADVELGQTVRVNITMNERFLQALDKEAQALGQKRSAYLVQAAKERMKLQA